MEHVVQFRHAIRYDGTNAAEVVDAGRAVAGIPLTYSVDAQGALHVFGQYEDDTMTVVLPVGYWAFLPLSGMLSPVRGDMFESTWKTVPMVGTKGEPGLNSFLDMKSIQVPTLLVANVPQTATLTWNVALPSTSYAVRFAYDVNSIGKVTATASNKTKTSCTVTFTAALSVSVASVVHAYAVPV